ncbi:hypothetical protein FQA39_LY14146 [Lamprigera yunnana]|nr:hypothetical protein FQA39_LY14146 [Lamprigera yunnana]
MNSTTRTTVKSGKNSKGDSGKSHKHDKFDTGKGSNDKQHGGSENSRSKNDDPGIKEKVRQLIEMTCRSNDFSIYGEEVESAENADSEGGVVS